MKNNRAGFLVLLVFLVLLGSCSTTGKMTEPFHETVDYVNLERFSGDWYVIALIPTPFEKNIANGVERYTFMDDGTIKVGYTFFKKSPEGKKKSMGQRGWVVNRETNAEWRVQPLWPLKLPYYILELDEDYRYTVIATDNYNYLWIMAREPELEERELQSIIRRMADRGFEENQIIRMEQQWN